MDLKRENSDLNTEAPRKRQKIEECPHALRCYRRNPHHFKEYDHPHLNKFLLVNEPKFPDSFKQDHQVYIEQLAVLRDIKNIKLEAKVEHNVAQTNAKISKNEHSQPTTSSSALKKLFNIGGPMSNNQQIKNYPNTAVTNKKQYRYANTMKEKLEICGPYNLFFNKVAKAEPTNTGYNCISFPDLICPSIGNLQNSIQLNFMIDVSWLIEQYQVHNLHTTPITIIYGYDFPMMKEYIAKKLPNVKPHKIEMKDPFGIHHSKIGIYKYEDDIIRIVISTANLYYEDWNHYNQGIWLSPPLPKMDATKQDFECAGPTGFKTDFLSYLRSYKLDLLNEWITLIKRADFSSIKVYFICSMPGRHYAKDVGSHIHHVGRLLSQHCTLPIKTSPDSEDALSWGVIAQSSSLGSFGKNAGEWLRPVLLRALASHRRSPLPATPKATLNIIYPTVANVLGSYFGPEGGGCLPYSKSVNEKQKWLKEYLHAWKANNLGRSRVMPHIKCYARVSPCLNKLAWCIITSANMSKAAWGNKPTADGASYVRSYEAGIIFMPHAFDEEYFYINRQTNDEGTVFPFMYDLPLESYTAKDDIWCN